MLSHEAEMAASQGDGKTFAVSVACRRSLQVDLAHDGR
jgi:hypothetical protein